MIPPGPIPRPYDVTTLPFLNPGPGYRPINLCVGCLYGGACPYMCGSQFCHRCIASHAAASISKLSAAKIKNVSYLTSFRFAWLNCILSVGQSHSCILLQVENDFDALVETMHMSRRMVLRIHFEAHTAYSDRRHDSQYNLSCLGLQGWEATEALPYPCSCDASVLC
jgi:hypothetical protein